MSATSNQPAAPQIDPSIAGRLCVFRRVRDASTDRECLEILLVERPVSDPAPGEMRFNYTLPGAMRFIGEGTTDLIDRIAREALGVEIRHDGDVGRMISEHDFGVPAIQRIFNVGLPEGSTPNGTWVRVDKLTHVIVAEDLPLVYGGLKKFLVWNDGEFTHMFKGIATPEETVAHDAQVLREAAAGYGMDFTWEIWAHLSNEHFHTRDWFMRYIMDLLQKAHLLG